MGYQRLVAEEIFSRYGLQHSVPGTALQTPTPNDLVTFGEQNLVRYAGVLSQLARPYDVDVRGRATRSEIPQTTANAATGLVTTVRDLARFDAVLRPEYNLLTSRSLQQSWTPVGSAFPTGLGWFVQTYNGTQVVWQFGTVARAYSAMIIKLPTRDTTFIIMANSDGLTAPFELEKGDATTSVFARLFLRIFVP
jgi:CubicO group peptidase (beta-lactamase class C family)